MEPFWNGHDLQQNVKKQWMETFFIRSMWPFDELLVFARRKEKLMGIFTLCNPAHQEWFDSNRAGVHWLGFPIVQSECNSEYIKVQLWLKRLNLFDLTQG